MPDFELEYELIDKGYRYVVGIDECAYGNLLGPVYAAAVIIDLDLVSILCKYVNDSKKMSPKKRDEMADFIRHTCFYAVGHASNIEIDTLNILNASKLAMRRAVTGLVDIGVDIDFVLVDGGANYDGTFYSTPHKNIIKGDSKSLSIAAASVVAKSAQCSDMLHFDKLYPGYGLAKNKGYGTKIHKEAIIKFGPCDLHRKSFKGVYEYT
jgi:ribonuclease HII